MAEKDTAKDPVLAALEGIQNTLTSISTRLETVETDQATLMANDEKLNGRINEVASLAGGVSGALGGEQIATLQKKMEEKFEEIESNPMLTRDPVKIKARHAQALKRAGEREREAGVHSMWHPELNPAKRDGLPLCKVVRTAADRDESRGLGYLDTLDEAAAALLKHEQARAKAEVDAFDLARKNGNPATAPTPARFTTVTQAKAALHRAEQQRARQQISQAPHVPQAPQPSASAA